MKMRITSRYDDDNFTEDNLTLWYLHNVINIMEIQAANVQATVNFMV